MSRYIHIGHQNTQNVSKCINSTNLPFFYSVTCLNLCSIQQIFFARIEILIQGPHHAPCSDYLSCKDGIDTYIERDGSNISFGQKQLLSLARGKAAKMCFFSHRCFFSFATFEVSTWFLTWRTLEKPDRSLFPALKKVFCCFALFFSGRQFSWTKAWWCGNLQYSFWMNVPQPWILSHRKRHRKPSWRISPGADDGGGSIVLKKSAAFWTSKFLGYTNEYHQYKRLSGFAPCLLNWLVFFCRTTTIAVAHRLVACLEWSIYWCYCYNMNEKNAVHSFM